MHALPRSLFSARILVACLLIILASTLAAPSALAAPITMTTTKPSSGPASTLTDPNCVQPPTTVDHATFTDAQVKLYGLPHRAKGESLAHWQRVVRAAKHRVCTGTATNISTTINNSMRKPGTIDEASSYWAGYIAINSGYSEAFGQWNVPAQLCFSTTELLLNGQVSAAMAMMEMEMDTLSSRELSFRSIQTFQVIGSYGIMPGSRTTRGTQV